MFFSHFHSDKAKNLQDTAREYRDGSVAIEDPRTEAAEIFSALGSSLLNGVGKDLAELTKINAAQYNNMLLSRRYELPVFLYFILLFRGYYLKMIKNYPQKQTRRTQLKDLVPSTEYLFGGGVKALCQDMKDSMELNPLATWTGPGSSKKFKSNYPNSSGRGGGFTRHYTPKDPAVDAPRGRGRGFRGRGGYGDRLKKFSN